MPIFAQILITVKSLNTMRGRNLSISIQNASCWPAKRRRNMIFPNARFNLEWYIRILWKPSERFLFKHEPIQRGMAWNSS